MLLRRLPSQLRTHTYHPRTTSHPRSVGGYVPLQASQDAGSESAAIPAAEHHKPRTRQILSFWLGDAYQRHQPGHYPTEKGPLWFRGGPQLDQEIKYQFGPDLEAAASGKYDSCLGYDGLAVIVLLDQFARNIHRGTPQMYATDARAISLANAIHESGTLQGSPPIHRSWLVFPLMHSEERRDLELALQRMVQLRDEAQQIVPYPEELVSKLEVNVSYTHAHKDVIDKWGRYPHRNKILERSNTAEEEKAFAEGSIPAF